VTGFRTHGTSTTGPTVFAIIRSREGKNMRRRGRGSPSTLGYNISNSVARHREKDGQIKRAGQRLSWIAAARVQRGESLPPGASSVPSQSCPSHMHTRGLGPPVPFVTSFVRESNPVHGWVAVPLPRPHGSPAQAVEFVKSGYVRPLLDWMLRRLRTRPQTPDLRARCL
jgi:hypothetical protein